MSTERQDGAPDATGADDRGLGEHLEELLMQRATGMLSAPEADALQAALDTLPPGEVARWEAAAAELAAAIVLAEQHSAGAIAPLPAWVEERVIATGEATVRVVRGERRRAGAVAGETRGEARMQAVAPTAVARTFATWGGWLAAAAAVVIAVKSQQPPVRDAANSMADSTRVASAALTSPARLARYRDSLLLTDTAALRVTWKATADSASRGAGGDVVWSTSRQAGVMRITGLAANDRKRTQYQLWIFDKTRDQRYPVDGGVFDIEPGATESFVRIDPRVPVGHAVMFAITVEPAGGVVVSTRERIALLAEASL